MTDEKSFLKAIEQAGYLFHLWSRASTRLDPNYDIVPVGQLRQPGDDFLMGANVWVPFHPKECHVPIRKSDNIVRRRKVV